MTQSNHTSTRHAWEYPDCRKCDTPVLVAKIGGTGRSFKCFGCGNLFDSEEGR